MLYRFVWNIQINYKSYIDSVIMAPTLNKIFSDQIPSLSEKEEDLLHQVKNVRTTPRDQRFPSQNQALHCWNRYNEWLVCLKQTGNDNDKCQTYRQYSLSICPGKWVEDWDEAREENTFYGVKN